MALVLPMPTIIVLADSAVALTPGPGLEITKQAGIWDGGECVFGSQLDSAGFLSIDDGQEACWQYVITNPSSDTPATNINLQDTWEASAASGAWGYRHH